MAEGSLSPNTVNSLSQKLDEFAEALTPDEHAVLLGLLSAASATLAKGHEEAEAEGGAVERAFISKPEVGRLPRLSGVLRETFTGIENIRDPINPVADSIGVGWLCVSWSKDYNKEVLGKERIQPGVENLRIPGLKAIR